MDVLSGVRRGRRTKTIHFCRAAPRRASHGGADAALGVEGGNATDAASPARPGDPTSSTAARYTEGRASGLVPHTGKTSCLHHSGDYSHAGEPDSTGPPEHSLLLLQVRL
ncbi:unnamed protein product [Gadus morhua 'NCC']